MEPKKDLYDNNFYESHTRLYGYRFLSRFLLDLFRPKTVVDFGCGIGETLRHLKASGCEVLGIEGSEAALEYSSIDILLANLTQPVDLGKTYDLAISTEVGEHLPETAADQFVSNIANHSKRAVFFTAAQPGQPGVEHINCQPKEYWAKKFATHGFEGSKLLDFCAKVALYPLIWDASWIRNNAQIFVMGQKPTWQAWMILPRFFIFSLWRRIRISRLGGGKIWLPRIGNW